MYILSKKSDPMKVYHALSFFDTSLIFNFLLAKNYLELKSNVLSRTITFTDKCKLNTREPQNTEKQPSRGREMTPIPLLLGV